MGYHMIIILAALQTIPKMYYETAKIDGANVFQTFKNITLPLVIPGLSISVMMSTIGALKQYGIVKVLTDGGPINATETFTYLVINQATDSARYGYGLAMGWVVFIIIIIFTFMQNRFFSNKEVKY